MGKLKKKSVNLNFFSITEDETKRAGRSRMGKIGKMVEESKKKEKKRTGEQKTDIMISNTQGLYPHIV